MTRPWAAWLGLLLLPPAIWATQREIDSRRSDQGARAEELAVWSGDAYRKLLPGFEQLLADVYWLRAVQYYGGERYFNPGSRFPLLEPLIDITVDLDPRFVLAYRYGAAFLAEHWPSGAGRPEAAEALLERGIAANPGVWQLYWDLGTTRFLFLEDPDGAAEVLLTSAELPGAPAWLKALGGRVLSDFDRRGTARLIWQQVYDEHTGAMRDNALMNLQYLDALDLVDEYRRRLIAFRERTGSWPASLAAVAGAGAARLPEIDPVGTAFDYNPESGRVRLSRSSLLWALVPDNQR